MEHVVCQVCGRTLAATPHFEPGVGHVGPECRKKVSGLLEKLDTLQLSPLVQGLTLDLQPNPTGGFSPPPEGREVLALAEQHGFKVRSEAKPGGKITYTVDVPRTFTSKTKKCASRATPTWVPQ